MDIKFSRRILILGERAAGALDIVQDLTGTAPHPDVDGSTAGLTHEWDVETPYYTAKVPIWIDEVSDVGSWKSEFLKDEAKEVVEAVGAWIFCFRQTQDRSLSNEVEEAMKSIQEVVEQHSYDSEVVMLAVAMPTGKQEGVASKKSISQEEQEDICLQYGFEYIDYAAEGKNEFGEHQGQARLKEALEANEWAASGDGDLDADDLDFGLEDEVGDFDQEEAEMTAELLRMKAALTDGDADGYSAIDDFTPQAEQADQVEDLDRLLTRLMTVKEQSAGLPEEQRKRKAAQAVRHIMKEKSDI